MLRLGALVGHDPLDAAMQGRAASNPNDSLAALDAGALQGARLGVARQSFGLHDGAERGFVPLLAALLTAGAVRVDPVTLPGTATISDAELTVLLFELKADLNADLQRLGPSAPVQSPAAVIAFNERHADREMKWFGQDRFIKALARAH